MDNQQATLNISWGAISKTIIAVIAIYILFIIKDIVIWFIFALVIGILFNYLVDILEKKRIPRILSATFLYLCVFAFLSFFIYKTTPILLNEFQDFVQNFPTYLQKISPVFEKFGINALKDTQTLLSTLQNSLDQAGASVVSALFSIFGGASSTILVLAMAFFITVEQKFFERALGAFAPNKYKNYLSTLWNRSKRKVCGWFLTRMIGILFVGGASYLVLSLFNVKYAFILALVAGVFDLVPIIGPIVAGTLITLIVAISSPIQALFVLIACVNLSSLLCFYV